MQDARQENSFSTTLFYLTRQYFVDAVLKMMMSLTF
jgi:hypothetical protein